MSITDNSNREYDFALRELTYRFNSFKSKNNAFFVDLDDSVSLILSSQGNIYIFHIYYQYTYIYLFTLDRMKKIQQICDEHFSAVPPLLCVM